MNAKVQGTFQAVPGAVSYRVKLTRNPSSPAAVGETKTIPAPTSGDVPFSFDVNNISAGEEFRVEIWADNGFLESLSPLVLNATFTPPAPAAPGGGTVDVVLV